MPVSKPTIRDIGSGYEFAWGNPLYIKATIIGIKRHKDERTYGKLRIVASNDGKLYHQILYSVIPLDYTPGQYPVKKTLYSRDNRDGVDWDMLLETVSAYCIKMTIDGSPIVEFNDTDETPIERIGFLLKPLIFEKMPTIMFAEPKTGKSLIAELCCIIVRSNTEIAGLIPARQCKALYLDYEASGDALRIYYQQMRRGHELTNVPFLYRRCSIPFVDDYDAIAKMIHMNDIELLIVDSLGVACADKNLNNAQAATDFYSSLRKLPVASLLITHTAKPQTEFQKDNRIASAFGSQYFESGARSIWELKKVQEGKDGTMDLMLKHKNANYGKRYDPMSFKVEFNEEKHRITFYSQDAFSVEEFLTDLPVRMRIRQYLEQYPNSIVTAISKELGIKPDTTRRTLKRYEDKEFINDGDYWSNKCEIKDT